MDWRRRGTAATAMMRRHRFGVASVVVTLAFVLGACASNSSDGRAPASFDAPACVIDEKAPIVAVQYFNSLVESDSGERCRPIDRVLPQCRASWDEAKQREVVRALGVEEFRLMSDNLHVDDHDDVSSHIRLIGTEPGLELRSSWVLDADSGRWMIDTCSDRSSLEPGATELE